MRFALIVLLACSLALAEAGTWKQSQDYTMDDLDRSPKWLDSSSDAWPQDVTGYPESNWLIHKVEKRMERLHNTNEQIRTRIIDYVSEQLRRCKSGNIMDEHCVRRSVGYAMSFINNQERQAL
ncbi:uncharacterized protein LOC115622045 [Scaptodrosophila lebanonensis]|uniref:Uncharacterized protein LOC115622045 n=1 Tax=Drosophila lebanonensis TaxID=7225 RepID=A0A6J2TA01_DROLE|nr:uncharacterized protein LOC115622045 [Scaptodrosophila lebanonensis]